MMRKSANHLRPPRLRMGAPLAAQPLWSAPVLRRFGFRTTHLPSEIRRILKKQRVRSKAAQQRRTPRRWRAALLPARPLAGLCLLVSLTVWAAAADNPSSLLTVDYKALVSRADLTYERPVERSEDGLPIGNGRMGSLVWTTPHALRFQINRADVFANSGTTDSFPTRNTDHCGGCGFVDIELIDFGSEAFPAERTTQHLSCYDGLVTVEGSGVKARILAWNERDVMAIEVTDEREQPGTIAVNLRMLRPAFFRMASHTATSNLESRNGRILLTQAFEEKEFFCGSAVAIEVAGREAEVRNVDSGEIRLIVKPGRGTFTVLIASAASFNREDNLASAAFGELDAAAEKGFASLLESNRTWWRDFWTKSFIHLHSADGVADEVERNYTYFLYLMASSSRGKYPAKFNGMLWTTEGDRRQWGGQFWGANQSCLYNNTLLAANHPELLDPMFNMYSGMADACARAAREQWGSQGLFIPETMAFDGPAPLPADLAEEVRDLYLLRKPWDAASQRLRDYAATKIPYSSQWNWVHHGRWENGRWLYVERGNGPYGPITHIFSRGAKIAYQYWLLYEFTRDEKWLRDRAYPMLKGVAEFYRNFPNIKKGEDGKYHIHHVNSNESIRGAQDTDEEIASMRGIFPVLIKASEILNVDADRRPVWQEFHDSLTPLVRSDHPDAQPPPRESPEPFWIRGLPPVAYGNPSGRPDGNTMPMWFFDLCTLESDPDMLRTGHATFNLYAPPGATAPRRVGVLSKVPLVAAVMGRADAVKLLIPAQVTPTEVPILANRMDLREGPQTTSAQRLGNAADALHTALCYDLPAGPGQPPVIRVFAAWPDDWDAQFGLMCRDGFLVASAMRAGDVEFVEILSQLGGECLLRNPWPGSAISLYRDGRESENLSGDLLHVGTRKGENLVFVRVGTRPEQYKRTVPANNAN
jgi:hypothetical protein